MTSNDLFVKGAVVGADPRWLATRELEARPVAARPYPHPPMLGDTLQCATLGAPGAGTSVFRPRTPPGPGTPLLLAPAFGLDGRSLERLSPLAESRPVAFWNIPNVVPEEGGVRALGRMMLDHADRAGFRGRVLLGGSSLGATIALAAALEAPDRVAGLVLVGGSACWAHLGTRLKVGRLLHLLLPSRGYHLRFARILFGPSGRSEDLDALRLEAEHRTKAHVVAVSSLLHEGGPYDLRPRLGEVRTPTLVLHDPGERVVPFRAARTLAAIPGARLVEVPRSGHLPYVSDPAACLTAIEPFLREVDAGARG